MISGYLALQFDRYNYKENTNVMSINLSNSGVMLDELRSTLGKLEIALSSVIDALVWINTNGEIQWSNNTFDCLVGKIHLEVLGAKIFEIFPLVKNGDFISLKEYPTSLVFETKDSISGIYEFHIDNKVLILDISGRKVESGIANVSAIFVIHDITENKKKEKEIKNLNIQLEKRVNELTTLTKELEAFSYSVSHDLRSPLRSIDGFSLALLEDCSEKLDSQGKDYLQRVRANCSRMSELIDDLLNLSRVTRSEIQYEKVDLSTIAQKIIFNLQKTQPERQVTFVTQDSLVTEGDPKLLYVALENLLNNAWKYTSKHSKAQIEFGALKENSRFVYYVKDDGAGFDMTFANKLFGPFQRLHKMTEFPGTGIGLATVQRIINKHGGQVWAEGEVEKGSTFYFTLTN